MKSSLLPRAFLLSGCLVLGTVALTQASRSEAVAIGVPLSRFPMQVGAWRGASAPDISAKELEVLGVDDYLNRVYHTESAPIPVGLYIGYYQSQREGDTMHSPLNCLPGSGWQPVKSGRTTITLDPGVNGRSPAPVEINRYIVQKGGDNLLVLYWYQSHGRVVASEYWGKIFTVVDSIRMNRTDAALVRVIIPIGSGDSEGEVRSDALGANFVQTMFPLLTKHLPL